MVTYITLIILFIGFSAGIYVLFSLLRTPVHAYTDEAEWISSDEIGYIEKNLTNLKEVILIADRIEIPNAKNYAKIFLALIDNFLDGVQYNFLVPSGFYDKHKDNVKNSYGNILQVAKGLAGENQLQLGTFNLWSWPYEKQAKDYPYLFYRYEVDDIDEIVAFRGEDVGAGISNHYRRLEPEVAKTIFMQALPLIYTQVISDKKRHPYEFAKMAKVISLSEVRKEADLTARVAKAGGA
jgi:hypothetical protein